ncbi:MAG: PAS domain-containing sensor histidine kinase [Halodesulfurarchaeum sp.]
MAANGPGGADSVGPGGGEFYRRLIEYSSDVLLILSEDGTIEFVSPSVRHVLGYDISDLLEDSAFERVHPGDRDRIEAEFEGLVSGEQNGSEIEYRYETAEGDWIWLEAVGQNRLDDPVIEGIVLVSREITDRKRREGALETLHDRTRGLYTADSRDEIARETADTAKDVLGHSITVVRMRSADGECLEPVAVTEEAERILGERPVYPIGEGTAGRAFEKEEAVVYQDLRTIEDGYDRGDARSGLFVPIGEYGVLAIGETEVGALSREDVQLARILAANAEVAFDRLEREQELKRQNERLENVASVISHDLQSPLTVARGRLELVEEESANVEAIQDALDRMEVLIEDVLSLARQGQTVDETVALALDEVASQCWSTVETGAATIEVETEKTIRADPTRLPEIFENLFRNAVEYGPPEGEAATGSVEETDHRVTITVGSLPDGFYVADDGQGIPESDRERVFDMGFTTAENGIGFGLPIVQEIAEAHGWQVDITDSEAGGARFEFTGVRAVEE